MYSRSAGTAYHSVAEGERVSKDSTIGSLFYGDVSDDSIKELTVVDNKIKKTKTEKSEESISTLDSNTLENNIYERENDIIDAAQDNDILSIAKYKKDINSLRQSNQLAEDNTEQELGKSARADFKQYRRKQRGYLCTDFGCVYNLCRRIRNGACSE